MTHYTIHILNHNFDPEPILHQLILQILSRDEDIKVVVWDDFSDEEYRLILTKLRSRHTQPFIHWNLEQKNVGRSAMRQKILDSTVSGWALSIDSDMLPDRDFIGQMISSLQNESIVYTGRHYYQNEQPPKPFLLHWHYGIQREIPAQDRDPYLHFSTGIFAWHGSQRQALSFTTKISGYGHEDTLFGLFLKEKKIRLGSSSMRAKHLGLTDHEEFISRQLEAVRNLQTVVLEYPDYRSRLSLWGSRLQKIPLLKKFLSREFLLNYCLRKLEQRPDKLRYLDLLKLHEWMKV